MSIMSERAFPIIAVENVPAVRAFYETLGFSPIYQFPPDGEPEYLTMERGGSSIGISAIGAAEQDRFGFWIYVDDVDSTLERLRTSGAPVVAEPEDNRGGSESLGSGTLAATSSTWAQCSDQSRE
jgi:predicted enzyme related to lactoylglutathione lyase